MIIICFYFFGFKKGFVLLFDGTLLKFAIVIEFNFLGIFSQFNRLMGYKNCPKILLSYIHKFIYQEIN